MLYKIPLLLSKKIKRFFQLPFMQRLKQKYPWLFAFIRKRFKTGDFFGLPFTILITLIFINLSMLSEITEHVVNSPKVKNLDTEVSGAFFNLRTPFISLLLYYFTQAGSVYGVTALTTLISILLLWKKRLYQLLALLVSVLGSGISMHFSKFYFHRERPLNLAYYATEGSFSFPSGHSTSAMALVGVLCYIAVLEVKSNKVRSLIIILGLSYILLMGFSRIYLGVHFLTDVAAGFLLGLLWVLLAVGLMEYSALKQLKRTKS
ncbi:phosphatase PAP2 family protein [Adhaeribacter radiodurans]|uniref:Phosphatase PAP2 family protein n=1 Tax=Adhaeribacter radiodurans TaxID=2745197 RepID=A0A7L7LBX9_9BACT|nr:phosphatase PAP2 family protein [Adhaeribacter radiodurans]QMU30352.1 phosphatase PAP2 family protein [Adhaeribacter radiodurans]